MEEIRKATRVLDLPRVTAPILFVTDYYDGPLSGAVMYEGRICWFATKDDPSLPKRRFFLYDLEDWELAQIVTRHFLFEMFVGTHHCNHSPGQVKPREMHKEFYDLGFERLDVTQGKRPIAKFIRKAKKDE